MEATSSVCPLCDGEGMVETGERPYDVPGTTHWITCPDCGGSGGRGEGVVPRPELDRILRDALRALDRAAQVAREEP